MLGEWKTRARHRSVPNYDLRVSLETFFAQINISRVSMEMRAETRIGLRVSAH
jgi:hypothetical protein